MGILHSRTPRERQSYLVQQTQPRGRRDPGDPSDFVAESGAPEGADGCSHTFAQGDDWVDGLTICRTGCKDHLLTV